jgi:hypothetical protein
MFDLIMVYLRRGWQHQLSFLHLMLDAKASGVWLHGKLVVIGLPVPSFDKVSENWMSSAGLMSLSIL